MGVASRRFYRAFYKWTLLTSPAEVDAVRGCVHGLHSTAANHKSKGKSFGKKPGKGAAREQKYKTEEQRRRVHRAIVAAAQAQDNEKTQLMYDAIYRPQPRRDKLYEWIERWEKAPVRPTTVLTFDEMRAWDEIVRHRTNSGIIIEVGVPESDLENMQNKYGRLLDILSLVMGAMIQVQDIRADANHRGHKGAMMIPVVISGTYVEVARAYHELSGFNSHSVTRVAQKLEAQTQVNDTQVDESNKPAPKPVDLEGASLESAEPEKIQLDESTQPQPKTVNPSMENPELEKPIGDMRVQSQQVMRSCDLVLREFVVREIEGTNVEIETSICEYDYAKFAYRNMIPRLAGKWKVNVSVGEPEQRPMKRHSDTKALARSLIISGDSNAVMQARADYFRRIGMREAQIKHLADYTQPEEGHAEGNVERAEKQSSEPASPEIAGHPADTYIFRCTKIVGPNFAMLKGIVNTEMTGDMGKKVVRGGLGSKNELLLAGEFPHLEEFHQQLQGLIKRLCDQHSLEPHKLEWSSSPVAEVVGRRPTDQTYEIFVHGPQAKKLWARLMQECVEGYRLYGETVIHIQKTEDSVLFTGPSGAAAAAMLRFRRRLEDLRRAKGYSPHEVVTTRRPAGPEELEGLVDRVRSTMRTLTHPVVLITSGRRNMTSAKASGGSKGTEEYLQGLRGATVSSFNAVTMEPQPVVSFNLKLPSRTWDMIRSTRQFFVHFLASNPRGAAIAETLTRPNEQPHAGFITLRDMGVQVENPVARGKFPGKLSDKVGGGIEAALQVDLLFNKCIEVEDHVIVVGKVFQLMRLEGSQDRRALSYAMRGFHSGEGKITPNHSPVFAWQVDDADSDQQGSANVNAGDGGDGLDPLELGLDIDSDVAARTTPQLPWQRRINKLDKNLAEDPVYRVLTTTKHHIMCEEAEDGLETIDAAQKKHNKKSAATEDKTTESETAEPSATSSPRASSTPSSPHTQAKRPYSTFARQPLDILGLPRHARRFASTSTTPPTNDLSQILDPSTAQSTVSDYLSTRDETFKPNGRFDLYIRQRRVAHLLNNQADITRLRELLIRGYKILEHGQEMYLTEAEMTSMNEKIITLERHADIVLAINAHRMLREMLDRARYGEIFWRQVPEFERMVEKGMKVLMDVARELRRDLDEGKISGKEFRKIGESLKWRYEGLEREMLRLRSVTEEEGDEIFGDDDD
ncbi:hypothetical protein BST61_g2595 [Cercospora zeina]